MGNVCFGAAWIPLGLLFLRRASTSEKAGAIFTLSHPEDLKMNPRHRTLALALGIAYLIFGT